ncbi:hypothetical protein E2C01_067777 [Portunus trituberculatus]|uniref:Uncharacterized protein n=1 Tax=Portunus trituberculatus TaxID=210409 RepID=A0A5B7HXN5_PORTR|nr:hypothetical protein [Portunus trituberculatus]
MKIFVSYCESVACVGVLPVSSLISLAFLFFFFRTPSWTNSDVFSLSLINEFCPSLPISLPQPSRLSLQITAGLLIVFPKSLHFTHSFTLSSYLLPLISLHRSLYTTPSLSRFSILHHLDISLSFLDHLHNLSHILLPSSSLTHTSPTHPYGLFCPIRLIS